MTRGRCLEPVDISGVFSFASRISGYTSSTRMIVVRDATLKSWSTAVYHVARLELHYPDVAAVPGTSFAWLWRKYSWLCTDGWVHSRTCKLDMFAAASLFCVCFVQVVSFKSCTQAEDETPQRQDSFISTLRRSSTQF